MALRLKIITPEKIVFEDDVDEVVLPTVNGEIAILPNHIGLVTQIIPGELIFKRGGKTDSIAITGGFLEVSENLINILADYAVRARDIEVARAEEAQKRAQKLMKEKATEKDFRIAQAELRKALLEIKVGSKYRKRSPIAP